MYYFEYRYLLKSWGEILGKYRILDVESSGSKGLMSLNILCNMRWNTDDADARLKSIRVKQKRPSVVLNAVMSFDLPSREYGGMPNSCLL